MTNDELVFQCGNDQPAALEGPIAVLHETCGERLLARDGSGYLPGEMTQREPNVRTSERTRIKLLRLFCLAFAAYSSAAATFEIADQRLEIELFAAAPQIVTPIGAACDQRNDLYVIESHTHLAPKNYSGPKFDRIKIFKDGDGDGKAESAEVFAEGFDAAMSCAFAPDGALFVLCAGEVWRLVDGDGDGRAEQRTKVLSLETEETYPHNKLLSLAIGPDERLYVGRGNTGGFAWTLRGAASSKISGYGDGGNIGRCRLDGSEVEEFATGFWNPFGLEFDSAGRLIAADNDPDARGPNRLVHVVPGGNYGHKHLYGGSGNHPFQAWNGELPGTLPYISGTGEAPCAVLDSTRGVLPADYAGKLMVAVWGEHTIELHATAPRGVSIGANRTVLVRGPEEFRPVALAPDARGNIYITDWVRTDYPNHGEGRIWRMRAKPDVPTVAARGSNAPRQDPAAREMERLARASTGVPELERALQSSDPLVRHAAVMALSRRDLFTIRRDFAQHKDSRVRLGALLALRRAGDLDREPSGSAGASPHRGLGLNVVRMFLRDPDTEVRLAALHWVGDDTLTGVRGDLDRAISGTVNATLFEAWLAAVSCLDPEYVTALQQRKFANSRQLIRRLPDGFIQRWLADETKAPALRALAVARLEDANSTENRMLLLRLARAGELTLRIEAIRSLARDGSAPAREFLFELARDASQLFSLRAEALTALESYTLENAVGLAPLLDEADPVLAAACASLLGRFVEDEKVRGILANKLQRLPETATDRLKEALRSALGEPLTRPASLEAWQAILSEGGDPQSGARIFFSERASCTLCHTHRGRGGQLGPDLSGIGQSATREKIIRSILRPSDDVAPQWQAWLIETVDGEIHQGLQLHPKSGGAYDLLTAARKFERFPGRNIKSVSASKLSLMPEGLEAAFTMSELRDLVAFLAAP